MTDPNELLQKINEVLEHKHATFAQLAEVVGEPEESLRHAIQNYTLEVRMLERISVELQLPLYRFFREPLGNLVETAERSNYEYYSLDEVRKLKAEIVMLKNQMMEQERQIKKLLESAKV